MVNWFITVFLTQRSAFKIIGTNCENIDLSAGFLAAKETANSSIWRFRAELALYTKKVKNKPVKKKEMAN
jgi:hypothetical protein